jgi:hypothetical protein
MRGMVRIVESHCAAFTFGCGLLSHAFVAAP